MWTDLQQAKFREVEFDFVDIKDGFKKTIAKFDYPYTDGSDLEDMGLEARTVAMKAVFYGDSYENLQSFLDALQEQGAGEVIHPVFGSFQAIPETVSILHDERAYYAEIDITFIEHLDLSVTLDIASAASSASNVQTKNTDISQQSSDLAGGALQDAGIPADITTTGLGTSGFMAAIAGYTSSVRSAMNTISSAVGTVQSYINSATSAFNLITSTVTYLTDLPGTILNNVAGAIESAAGAYQSLIDAPGKFMDSLENGLTEIESALSDFTQGDGSDSSSDIASNVLNAAYQVSQAQALAAAAAVEFAADEAAEKGRSLNLQPFGATGTVGRTQLMTLDEIDAVAASSRNGIAKAITAVRKAYGDTGYDLVVALKEQALTIQQTADSIRLRRERIIAYEVPSDMPLHLLAFNLYGDISGADKLLRINNIRNPNFLKAGETLRVYA